MHGFPSSRLRPALILAALSLVLQAANAQPKAPIRVGAVSSVKLFPEATAAVKAYFDIVNAAGGIQGRPLQLIVEDDQAEPAAAAAAARRLVEHEQAVAHVGSASALECSVNAGYYEAQGIVSIQGTGVDPSCFASANISPVNAGPYLSTRLALQFLTEIRLRDKVCVYATRYAAVQAEAFSREVQRWSLRSGRRPLIATLGMPVQQPLADMVAQAVQAGCQGVVYAGVEAHVLEWLDAVARSQHKGIDWVFLTPAYTQSVADRLGSTQENVFAMSEFEPWSSRSGMLSDWRDVMTRGRVARTSFSQGGYVAALVFVRALRAIKGEINRATVTRALKELPPQKLPLLGTPYAFGPGQAHASNRANVPVQLREGRWVVAHWDFIVAPADD